MLNPTQPERIKRGDAVCPLMVLLSLLIIIGTATAAIADAAQDTSRKIVSDDFTKSRQEAAPATANNKTPQGGNTTSPPLRQRPIRRTYRLASQPAIRTRPSS